MCNVSHRGIRVNTVAMKTRYCIYLFISYLDVAVNSVAMEKQPLVSLAPLSNCETFRNAVNSKC
jgi:hypothetical protein